MQHNDEISTIVLAASNVYSRGNCFIVSIKGPLEEVFESEPGDVEEIFGDVCLPAGIWIWEGNGASRRDSVRRPSAVELKALQDTKGRF